MESTALTVIERASVALGASEHEKKLRTLAHDFKDIIAITNQAGYQQVHAARMVLKNERVALEKLGKAARDDATKFSKAVIAEEQRLIGIIEPEEKRLQSLQSEWDAIEERKRQAEAERIAGLQARIEAITAIPLQVAGKPSDTIMHRLQELEELNVQDFAEFAQFAQEAKDKTIAALTQLHAGAMAQEKAAAEAAEKARRDAEELARLRAAEEERQKQEQAQLAEEAAARQKAEAEARARIEAEEQASRARIAEEERIAKQAREAEEQRIAKERAQRAEKQAREDARLKAEREAIEAKQREVQRRADELLSGAEMLRTFIERFGRRKEFEQVVAAIRVYLQAQPKQTRKAA